MTPTESAWLNEMRAERDVLKAELRGYKRSYENVMAERDALLALVETLRAALEYSDSYLNDSQLNSIGHGSKAHWEMRNALNQPTPSIERLKAQWQAEALEEFSHWAGNEIARDRARRKAEQLRYQAEGKS